MSTPIYISRNFTEFGAFTPAEILDFKKRGILAASDFVRADGSDSWTPLGEWTAPVAESVATPAPKVTKPKAAAKTPAAPKAAKKAAKKTAAAAE